MEKPPSQFEKVVLFILKKTHRLSNLTFYFIPLVLGFSTALMIREEIVLGNKKKIMMTLAEFYEKTDSEIPIELKNEFPELQELVEKGREYEKNKKL